jgi:type VI secretion system protein VasI
MVEKVMLRAHVLAIVILTLVGCGVPRDEHQRTLRELETARSEITAANKRVQELQAEVARLSETDAAQWKKILELKSHQDWPNVIRSIDDFVDRWPGSPYLEQARRLRAEATEAQAAAILAEAKSEMDQQRFEEAKAKLLAVREEYPSSRSRASADKELRTIDAKIALARRRAAGTGAWRTSTEISPIDDSTNVHLSLDSSDTIAGQFGDTVQPVLYVRCKERKTEVFVVWGVYLGIGETDVLQRLDDSPARTLEWSLSTDYKAAFYPGSDVAFARELQKHERLLLRVTPYGEKPVTATFNLAGLENALELKKACRWN